MPNRGAATVRFASANSLGRIPLAVGKGSACVRLCRPCASTYGRPEPSHAAWHGMQCLATAQHASCRPRATRAWLAQSRLLRSAWCRNGKRSAAICSTACRNIHIARCNIHYTTYNMHHAAYILASPIEAPPPSLPLSYHNTTVLVSGCHCCCWLQWSECTTSCGGGVRSRQRLLLSTSATRFGLGGADYTG